MHVPGWRGAKSGQVWRSSPDTYVHPVIGDLAVGEVTPGHVIAVLEPIWNEKRETARRVSQRISAICRWAVAQGHRTDDPAGVVIDAALPRNAVERRHVPALPYDEVAECISKVRGSAGVSESSKLALEFLVLTAARSGEVRKATWDEIDPDGVTWTEPAERMNANREHRVPLSKRALEVLAAAAELSDGSGLVFPGMRPGHPLSENTHAELLRELGFDAATHGFRSSFRDYAAEQTHTPHAVMEAAPAHVVRKPLDERRLSTLTAAILKISESLDLDTVLQEGVEGARALTGARYGAITPVDASGWPETLVTSGFTDEARCNLVEWPDGPKLFAFFRDLHGPLQIPGVTSHVESLGFSAAVLPSGAVPGTPMRHRGAHVGNFYLVEKESANPFNEEDEEILMLFASQAATAIANARTHRAEQRARADLEALVETSPVGVAVFEAATGALVSLILADATLPIALSVVRLLTLVYLRRWNERLREIQA